MTVDVNQNNYYKLSRLFINQKLKSGDEISLPQNHTHYLRNVMRKTQGDRIRLFNGKDGEFLCTISTTGKKSYGLYIGEKIKEQPEDKHEYHLLFAPIKKDRMAYLIEKVVELGVTHIHPVLTQNTDVRKTNHSKLEQYVTEAAEQCERLTIPVILPLQPLESTLENWQKQLPLFACLERTDSAPITEVLHSHPSFGYLIGPAGGFTAHEAEALSSHPKITPVSLGKNILRSETAAILPLALKICEKK